MGVNRSAIRVGQADGVTTISLDRPERRNAVDEPTAAELHAAIRAAGDDPGCRVVVLRGEGPAFCAGWDVASIADLRERGPEAIRAAFEDNRRLMHDLRDLSTPTIAAVHGAVMGFGIGLAAACDLVIAARGTRIALPEIALGVVPGMVMLDIADAVPAKVALDWLLSGTMRTADEALAAGLLSRVVDDEALDEAVASAAAAIAAHDPGVAAETKRLFRSLATSPARAVEDEIVAQAAAALLR